MWSTKSAPKKGFLESTCRIVSQSGLCDTVMCPWPGLGDPHLPGSPPPPALISVYCDEDPAQWSLCGPIGPAALLPLLGIGDLVPFPRGPRPALRTGVHLRVRPMLGV